MQNIFIEFGSIRFSKFCSKEVLKAVDYCNLVSRVLELGELFQF